MAKGQQHSSSSVQIKNTHKSRRPDTAVFPCRSTILRQHLSSSASTLHFSSVLIERWLSDCFCSSVCVPSVYLSFFVLISTNVSLTLRASQLCFLRVCQCFVWFFFCFLLGPFMYLCFALSVGAIHKQSSLRKQAHANRKKS